MEYPEVLEYLLHLERMGMKLGLDNINKLLSFLGNPHKAYPSIHIAGTNGKGSSAAIIESILANSGYRIGLYTSPHLVDFRERIRINGRLIDQKYVSDFFSDTREKFESVNPTFFEAVTALAFIPHASKLRLISLDIIVDAHILFVGVFSVQTSSILQQGPFPGNRQGQHQGQGFRQGANYSGRHR